MPSTTPYSLNDIGMAWSFVLDCEDEEPRSFGVDLFPALPERRHGVYALRAPAEEYAWLAARADVEDAMIASLDEDDDDDDFEPEVAAAPALFDEDDVEPMPSFEEETVVPDQPVDRLPLVIGHRRDAVGRSSRIAAALRDAALAY